MIRGTYPVPIQPRNSTNVNVAPIVDIPIGLPDVPDPRPADIEARKLLGRRGSSVFPIGGTYLEIDCDVEKGPPSTMGLPT